MKTRINKERKRPAGRTRKVARKRNPHLAKKLRSAMARGSGRFSANIKAEARKIPSVRDVGKTDKALSETLIEAYVIGASTASHR